jgi:hypothetical protein
MSACFSTLTLCPIPQEAQAMNKPRQQPWRVRIEHEPNRFSSDCLERIYEQLHPTKSRKVTADKDSKQSETEPQKSKRGQQ